MQVIVDVVKIPMSGERNNLEILLKEGQYDEIPM
jgi:hypothetical protein